MNKALAILTTIALTATLAGAQLVGSLHLPATESLRTNDVTSIAGLPTRTNNGNANTQGTVEGSISWLVSTPTNNHVGADITSYSGNTQIGELNRYGGAVSGGICVWDFDVSGVSASPAWELKVDYTRSRAPGNTDNEWYISFNGLGRTLDTTVVTNLAPGAGAAMVADATKYVTIGVLPAGVDATNLVWDLTDIIAAAQTNGGGVRLVYHDHTFKEKINFYNDSGLIAVPSTTGTPVVFPTFYIADDFSDASGDLGEINGWTKAGPEPKEYNNSTNSPGILNLRDHNNDERGTGVSEHSGYWDSLTKAFEGLKLENEGDWLELSFDMGLYMDDSGAMNSTNYDTRVTLTDSTKTNNAGFGFQIGTYSAKWHKLALYDTASDKAADLTFKGYQLPMDGSLQKWTLRIERTATDFVLTPTVDGLAFSSPSIPTTNAAMDVTFDQLFFTVAAKDVGMKIDNVLLISNVDIIELTPYEKWAELQNWNSGDSSITGNPDGDVLENWREYIFGGDPTLETDIGFQPLFALGGYVYTLRNDISLKPLILTRVDLKNGAWTTNDVATPITLDDGGLSSYTNGVGTGVEKQFYKLIVE